MANINGAFGLRPIAKMGQSTNSTGASEYRIAAGNTNAIFQGSPVIPLAAGVIDIVGAAAGGTVGLLGVFWGCEYVSSTTGKKVFSNQWPGSGADTNFPVKAFVYDDPAQLFVIATSNVVAAADTEAEVRAAVFANANFAFATSGVDHHWYLVGYARPEHHRHHQHAEPAYHGHPRGSRERRLHR
jgi:hypothetical protein